MSINYEFGDLEAFLAVKSTGSFHLAAAQLNLSQSAVTRRIRKLELALDSVLFERTTRAVRPTLAAKRLQARAEAILEEATDMSLAMRDDSVAFAHQRGAVITVATVPTVVPRLFPPALKQFRDEGFLSRVRILDMAANDVAEAVTGGEADFGICSIPMYEPAVNFAPLFEDRIVLAMNPEHRLAQQKEIAWPDLRDETLALPARGTGNRLLIDEALAGAGLALHWTYEMNRSATGLALAAGGTAIALLPGSVAGPSGQGGTVTRPLHAPVISRTVGLLSRAGQQDSAAVSGLRSCILKASETQPD